MNPHPVIRYTPEWGKLFFELLRALGVGSVRPDSRPWEQYILNINQECDMGVFSNAFSNGETGKTDAAFSDPDFGIQYPVLHAFMTSLVDDDGNKRVVSTVMLFCEDGVCKGALRERNHDLTLWVSSESVLGCFRAFEDHLSQRPIPWRKNNVNGSSNRTKR